ncbi:MAG: hypothetical protein PHQ43_01160 [Dehalococcoidales bacterium]|nr:hypothetical protein [Dehalococcoidales bacterium]
MADYVVSGVLTVMAAYGADRAFTHGDIPVYWLFVMAAVLGLLDIILSIRDKRRGNRDSD